MSVSRIDFMLYRLVRIYPDQTTTELYAAATTAQTLKHLTPKELSARLARLHAAGFIKRELGKYAIVKL